VSLILDALRKLEHEKNAREPGVLVVGSVPWGERRRPRWPLALVVSTLVALAIAGWWWLRATAHPTASTPGAVSPASTLSPRVAVSPTAPPRATLAPSLTGPAPPARRLDVPTPAAAAAETRPAPVELRLNAITSRDGRPVALVNDRLVFEGDSFDGVRILRIGEAEVEVEVRGQRRVLRF
jgi:hypothetical protein